jgi:succinate dehydrogenase / fumarate reductase membrane anchor subunit
MDEGSRPVDRPDGSPRPLAAFVGQVVSGVALLVLLAVHMVAQHFTVPTGLRYYDDVIAWLGHPVVVVVEVAFLVFVTYHALLGVRAILFDFGFSERTERRITRALWLVGIGTVVYGVGLLAAILSAA